MLAQFGNFNTQMESIRNNQMEILKNKNPITEMKNAFDGLIRRLKQPRKA